MPDVSVIIPVHNAESYLRQAAESALAQAETGEVLLVEDGSSDDSLSVCEELEAVFDIVRLLRHPFGQNLGISATRNVGIHAARYPYIAFLDADDYYLPERFVRALHILKSDPSVDGVYEAVGTQFDTEEMKVWWENERGKGAMTTLSEAVPPGELLATLCGQGRAKGWICTPGLTVRRQLFDRTGLFVPELRMSQDTAMWLKMAAVGRLEAGSLDTPVAMRRLHGNNRIFKNRGREHKAYDVQARTHVYEWAVEKELGPEILNPLFSRHLGGVRKLRVGGRRRQRLGLRDLPWLLKVGLRQTGAWRSPKYRKYFAEATYWTSAGCRLRRSFFDSTE